MNTNFASDVASRILVIDDEPTVVTMLGRMLRGAGYEVGTAMSGPEGLELFRQESWDLVTVDRAMPGMNGEEVTKELKRIAPNIPVVLITGFPGAVNSPALFSAILAKPFRSTELLQCLADTLARNSGCGESGSKSKKGECGSSS